MSRVIAAFTLALVSILLLSSAHFGLGELADTPWPKFKHDAQNTGRSPYAGPQTAVLKWSYLTPSDIAGAPAIGQDGTIYIPTIGNDAMYALNRDGTLKWKYTTGGGCWTSPAIGSDNTIYFGTDDGKFYAMNPDGTLKWTYSVDNNSYFSAPAIASDGTIYVVSSAWLVRVPIAEGPSLQLETSKFHAISPDGTLKWSYDVPGTGPPNSPAIASDGAIYFTFRRTLYALNPSGTLKWSYATNQGTIYSSPAIGSDGTIYFGNNNKLYAVDSDGTLKWVYLTKGDIISSPAISTADVIYVGTTFSTDRYGFIYFDNKLYAINSNGTLKWSYTAAGEIWSSPTIGSGGTVYFVANDGKLYALDANGALNWSCVTKVSRQIKASPIIDSDGTIYFVVGNRLYAIAHPPPTPPSSTTLTIDPTTFTLEPGRPITLFATLTVDGNPVIDKPITWDATAGTVSPSSETTDVWGRVSATYIAPSYPTTLTVTASFAGDDWFLGSSGDSQGTITAPRPASAQLADTPWPKFRRDLRNTGISPYIGPQENTLRWSYTAGYSISTSPAIGSDGTIYFGSYQWLHALNLDGTFKWSYKARGYIGGSPAVSQDGSIYFGSEDGNLYALNPDGTLRWTYPTEGSSVSSPTMDATSGNVYFGSDKLYALNPDGTFGWSYATGDICSTASPAIASDSTIYVGSLDWKLYALKPDGTLKWSYTTDGSIHSSPAIATDGTIYIGSQDGKLYAINPDGTLKWSYSTGSLIISSPAIGPGGIIYIGSTDGAIYALNPDGALMWSYTTGGEIGWSSPAIGADGTIYFGSKDNKFYALNPDGTLKWSYTTGGKISHSSPAIGLDGTIYFGSCDGKFYAIGTGLLPHDPIYIDGNTDFTPANGITSGLGTASNPYIIENWQIVAGGVEIRNTDAHFIIQNVHAYGRGYAGIHLDNVKNGKILNNAIINDYTYGIFLYLSSNNLIENNLIKNSVEGIWLDYSWNSVLRGNIFLNNRYSFGVQGWDLSHFYHDIDISNFIDGKPIHYIVEGKHLTFDGSVTEVGYLGLIACENIQVRNLNISNNKEGILLAWTSGSEISDSVFLNNDQGIKLFNSSNNSIIKNTTRNNSSEGIAFSGGSSNNLIENNLIRNNLGGGISFYRHSSNNVIVSNFIENNQYGIELIGSSYNSIVNNTVENNRRGIYLIFSSDGNSIYHNNLINNREMQAYDNGSNYWDNGSEGNYWSNYSGKDMNDDGMGDTPHTIPGDNNQDRYPLISPFVSVTKPPPAPTRWPLIVGIVGAMVIISISTAFYVRKMCLKRIKKRRRRKKR